MMLCSGEATRSSLLSIGKLLGLGLEKTGFTSTPEKGRVWRPREGTLRSCSNAEVAYCSACPGEQREVFIMVGALIASIIAGVLEREFKATDLDMVRAAA